MNVLYVYADGEHEMNCSKWNCLIPAKYINKLEGHTANTIHINDWVKNDENSQKLSSEADIIVVERNYFGDTLTIIQYWKVRGKTIIGIFDDAYHIMHPMNPSYRFWNYGEIRGRDREGNEKVVNMNPTPIEQFKWGLKLLKGIQVPSVNLAKDWLTHTDTYFVHNFLDWDKYENIEPMYPHGDDEIIIGWHGSLSHYSSFVESGVLDALRKIGKKYPHVKVLLGGDKRNFDNLEVKNKVFQPYVPEDQFTSLIKSFDIGLAPLSGEYDKRRSWIKVLEYMALQVPWVATDYITYDELKPYGIVTENGYTNWVAALSNAIENIAELKEKAKKEPFEFAKSQSSEIGVRKVTLPLYQQLIDGDYPNILRE